MKLKLFFTYYGGKWRIARYYPFPKYETIIEPFAGSAGYSLHYADRNIKLYDIDPKICGLWDYLIHASSSDILSLPSVVSHVDEIGDGVPEEAKWLIGFWLNKATTQPSKRPSLWMRQGLRPNSFWGEVIKKRIAEQVNRIRHWKIQQKSFENIDNETCTWFIDPPYLKSGNHYKYNSIVYDDLAVWCLNRLGQVIVCEQDGATWLPFKFFRDIKTTEGVHGKRRGKEVVWVN